MKGVLAVGSLAAHALFGPAVAGAFSLLLAVSLMSTVNAMVTIGPRLYYAMAKNGAFLPVAARVSERWRTPVPAILTQGACAMLMTLVNFGNLMTYIGYLLNLFALLAVLSLFWLRRRAEWQKLPVVSFCYPLVPLLFVVPGVILVVVGLKFAPAISMAAALTLISGAAVYRLRLAQRAH
jgi:APA family basic amino acid/polyamine antiporter